DSNENVQGQGNTIKLLQERSKTFDNPKCIYGGTPTITGMSSVDEAYEASDKRSFWVVCHECDEPHILSFKYLTCTNNDFRTATYACPHCGVLWDDNQRVNNIRISRDLKNKGRMDVGWIAEKEFKGVAGFALNELYSAFPGSRHSELMKKWLSALEKFNKGGQDSDTDLIAFINSSMGLSYEYPKDTPPLEELKARGENYHELYVPMRGLFLSAGVDVQHDRLAIIIRAWCQYEESWLIYWGEIFGDTSVSIRDGKPVGAWKDFDDFIHNPIFHESGHMLNVKIATIDSSDGKRTDAVYQYVRHRSSKNGIVFLAGKGASKDSVADTNTTREIFTPAKPIDVRADNKYAKLGVQVFIVGTSMAKDLILGTRVKLAGDGPGVMHFYSGVREDYYEQLLSEVKAPRRGHGKQKLWQKIVGVRNEALDCEVYCLHAARAMKIHIWNVKRWEQERDKMMKTEVVEIPVYEEIAPDIDEPVEMKKVIVNVDSKKTLHRKLA
ncbi:MAG TPA: terminase gpA endonuclease subunit, partial [Methanosarcina sp.]|nr:terminase gpA endonuclease subunit [Methanosarcina sp.]